MSLTQLLVPTFQQMLTALSNWLEKAEGQMPASEAEALLSARLAPDMFPLSTQVRFACVQAHEATSRLRDKPLPGIVAQLLDEGRNADSQPGSLSDARARIDETLAMLSSLDPDALDIDPESPVVHDLPNGMTFDLTALQYARDWTLSQFYFHVMTAYSIMRSQGVALGKADYIPHMLGFIRTGAPSDG